MDIYAKICSSDVLDYLFSHIFPRRIVLSSRKDLIHINIEYGYAPCNSVRTQRIQHGINVHYTVKLRKPTVYSSYKLVADILSLQLISMDSRYNCYALFSLTSVLRQKAVFLYLRFFVCRKAE